MEGLNLLEKEVKNFNEKGEKGLELCQGRKEQSCETVTGYSGEDKTREWATGSLGFGGGKGQEMVGEGESDQGA